MPGGASETNDDRAFLVVSNPEVLGAAYDQGVDVQVLSTTNLIALKESLDHD